MEIPEPFLLWEVGRRVLDEPHQVGVTPLEMLDELETPTGGFQSPLQSTGPRSQCKAELGARRGHPEGVDYEVLGWLPFADVRDDVGTGFRVQSQGDYLPA